MKITDTHIGLFKKIRPLQGGMMNSSFICSLFNKEYVVYIPNGDSNSLVNRKLEKKAQKTFFKLGLTSKNAFFNTKTGVKGNVYIKGESLNNLKTFSAEKVAKAFHTLHDAKLKIGTSYNPLDRIEGLISNMSKYGTFDKRFYTYKEYIDKNEDLLRNAPQVLCHGDAQKSNIVKGEDGNYYFIDFEFSMDNDPMYDIACFANGELKEGYDVLKAYFSNIIPSEEEKRFFLWRVYISLQWYLFAFMKDATGEGEIYHYDFKAVGEHFLNIAKECINRLEK